MVPTEFMAAAVAMPTDALPQLFYFDNEFFMCHLVKVGVHNVLPMLGLSYETSDGALKLKTDLTLFRDPCTGPT